MPPFRFVVFILVSLVAFVAILFWCLRRRPSRPHSLLVVGVSLVVVVAGMLFAKLGAMAGLHWSIYYGVPALTTLLLPPLAFRMTLTEMLQYVLLAFSSSPAIHVLFSFLLGWHEYMPFWYVPSLTDVLGG